jgi:hypothetical protein
VDDSFRVCRVQGIRDLDAQIKHGLGLKRLARDQMAESLPLQQLHRNEGLTIRLVNLIDGADIRVVQ